LELAAINEVYDDAMAAAEYNYMVDVG